VQDLKTKNIISSKTFDRIYQIQQITPMVYLIIEDLIERMFDFQSVNSVVPKTIGLHFYD